MQTAREHIRFVVRHYGARRRRGRPPKPRIPPSLRRIEVRHAARIIGLIGNYREIVQERLLPVLPSIVGQAEAPRPRLDDWGDEVSRIFGDIRVRYLAFVTDERTARAAERTAVEINEDNAGFFAGEYRRVLGVDPLASEPWLLPQVNAFMRENAALIKGISDSTASDIQAAVLRGVRGGLSAREISHMIQEEFAASDQRARLVARDQVNKFNGGLTELRHTANGLVRYDWWTSLDERVRDDHRVLHGQTFRWNAPPVTVTKGKRAGERNHPGGDIQCLLGSSQVEVEGVCRKLYRRRYSGPLTTLVTESGESVSATPNHPILTANGWVPIESVNVGDHVFKGGRQGLWIAEAHVEHPKPCIAEVFEALAEVGFLVRGAGAASQFHGDGSDEEIEIVSADCPLPDELGSPGGQERCKLILSLADEATPDALLAGTGGFEAALRALFTTTDSVVRGASKLFALYGGKASQPNHIRLACVARLNTVFHETGADRWPSHTVLFRQSQDTQAGEVITRNGFNINLLAIVGRAAQATVRHNAPTAESLAEVVRANAQLGRSVLQGGAVVKQPTRVVKKFIAELVSSHVYNLETSHGWYFTGNVITKNCRCKALPIYSDLLQ